MFYKIGVLKTFCKIHRKTPVPESLFNKLTGLYLATLLKGYLRYKTITSQNVPSKAKIKNFFYFVEKLCSVPKIFKFWYF